MAQSLNDGSPWVAEREHLRQHGYAILRALLTRDEVLQLRETIVRHLRRGGVPVSFGRIEPLAAVELGQVHWLFSDRRIVTAVARVLDTPTPVFTFHCDVHRNAFSDWHKDTGESVMPGGYFGAPIFDLPDCNVVKLAIYCEDHDVDDAGFHVQPGSHRSQSLEHDRPIGLGTVVGDIVIFDVRITHMGEPQPRYFQPIEGIARRLPRAAAAIRSTQLRARGRTDRVSAFFSFGTEGDLTDRFAQSNLARACRQSRAPLSASASLAGLLADAGIAVARIPLTDAGGPSLR